MTLIDLEQAKEVVRDSCKRIPTMAIVTMQNLEKLPVIEPRAKGAWVEVYDSSVGGHNSYSCSNCGLTIVTNPDYLKKHKFCFACGADMREVDTDD